MSVNILIVDDEKDIRMLVAGILQDEGYNVLEAGNSDEALSLYKSERPDLVILDIWLEGSPRFGAGQHDRLCPYIQRQSGTPAGFSG